VTSLDVLQNCQNLRTLHLCDCDVLTSLDGLQNCPNLKYLYLFRSGVISRVTSLAGTGLEHLPNLRIACW
jgi:Leucine-rich repeat (LRR) protein